MELNIYLYRSHCVIEYVYLNEGMLATVIGNSFSITSKYTLKNTACDDLLELMCHRKVILTLLNVIAKLFIVIIIL